MAAIVSNAVIQKELRLWGLFCGAGHGVYTAARIDQNTIGFLVGSTSYRIALSEKADAHAEIIGFDGFFLRHSLAGAGRILDYQYMRQSLERGEREHVELRSKPGNVRRPSKYEFETLREPLDYYQAGETAEKEGLTVFARKERSERHFLSLPHGSRSLMCHLKPRSLERRYVVIEVQRGEVRFLTCNSY